MVPETVVIVASGPSVKNQPLAQFMGQRVLVVNDAWRLAPWASALYAADCAWWEQYAAQVRERFAGICYTCDEPTVMRHPWINHVKARWGRGLGRDGWIHFNGQSGFQALNLAVSWGAKQIILCGFDCQKVEGRRHFFGNHPGGLDKESPYESWQAWAVDIARDLIEMGVDVVNTSPTSALKHWRYMDISDAAKLAA